MINKSGGYFLFARETKRFLKVYHQSILAPISSAAIFYVIFILALDRGDGGEISGINHKLFIAYGLIMMSVVQNAYANTSSSLIMMKVIGYLSDILIPPLKPAQLITAFVLAGVLRALIIAACMIGCCYLFLPITMKHPAWLLVNLFISGFFMAQMGLLAGLYAKNFDQISALQNYLVMPLSMLSGTFYSVKKLPEFFQEVNNYNPIFHMIDGFRFCMTGISEKPFTDGLIVMAVVNIVLFMLLHYLFSTGWRIRD